jgi:hypothetical protein
MLYLREPRPARGEVPQAWLSAKASPLNWVDRELDDTQLVLVVVCDSNGRCLIGRSPIQARQLDTVRARNTWEARSAFFRLRQGRHNEY